MRGISLPCGTDRWALAWLDRSWNAVAGRPALLYLQSLVDLLSRPTEPHFEGRSRAPLLRDGAPASSGGVAPPVTLQLEPTGYGLDTREHAAGIVQDSSKLLLRRSGHTEAYDLHADPGEQNANPASLAGAADALARTLETTQADLARRASSGEHRAPLDEATREKLRALGYQF